METYLLTWNPNRSKWDDLPTEANQTAAGKILRGRWSCGNTKNISKGSRVFLIHLGKEPKGIIASGWIKKQPYLDKHWDKAKAKRRKKALFVFCEWERILNPRVDPPLPLSILQRKLKNVYWASQSSGIQIPDYVATRLENLWATHLRASSLGSGVVDDTMAALEGKLSFHLVRHRRREVKLKKAKLVQFQKKNGRLYCEVPGCGFDFKKIYGLLGKDFAHVHHLKPLGDRQSPSETNLNDLAVVCANCHAMVHRGGKSRKLSELIP
jgi:5-methylcytosine-specific restriction protein A